VPIIAIVNFAEAEKARHDSIARADSISGKRDSTKRDSARLVRRAQALAALQDTTPKLPPPKATRAMPPKEYLLTTGKPLVPGAFYRLEARNMRNLLGDTATSLHSVQLPKPVPPPPPKPGAAPKPGAKPDSTSKPAAPDTTVKPPAVAPAPPKPPAR
jgi:hypothetical protein